jgi:hypothetical protein
VPKTAPLRQQFDPVPTVAVVSSHNAKQLELRWMQVRMHDPRGIVDAFSERLRERRLFRSVQVVASTKSNGAPARRTSVPYFVVDLEDFQISTESSFWGSLFRMMVFMPRSYYFGARLSLLIRRSNHRPKRIVASSRYRISSRQLYPEAAAKKALVALAMDVFDQAINNIAKEVAPELARRTGKDIAVSVITSTNRR